MIIRTTYVPATDTEGSKIRVDDGVTVRHVPWRHNLSISENHEHAVGEDFVGDEWYANGEYVGWAWVRGPLTKESR